MTHSKKAHALGLTDKDIIHNPKDKSYRKFTTPEKTYQIDNFLNLREIEHLKKVFKKAANKTNIFDVISVFHNPLEVDELDWLAKKIHGFFPNTQRYVNINQDDKKQSSDFIMEQSHMFPAHTDSIIHIENYVPYKDLLLPLDSYADIKEMFYTCKQRYYGRATSFRLGNPDDVVALYSNSIQYTKYEDYGVEDIDYAGMDDFYNSHLKNDKWTVEAWSGLTLDSVFDWNIGSMIVMDPSTIHGPTNYALSGGKGKLGLTIRLFKYDPTYKPSTVFSILDP
jgi:hypothetical protein